MTFNDYFQALIVGSFRRSLSPVSSVSVWLHILKAWEVLLTNLVSKWLHLWQRHLLEAVATKCPATSQSTPPYGLSTYSHLIDLHLWMQHRPWESHLEESQDSTFSLSGSVYVSWREDLLYNCSHPGANSWFSTSSNHIQPKKTRLYWFVGSITVYMFLWTQ